MQASAGSLRPYRPPPGLPEPLRGGWQDSQRERPDAARIDFSRLGPILRSSLDPLIATLRASRGETEIRKAADALAAAVRAEKGRGTLTAGTAGLGVKELKDSLVALQAKQ